MRLFAVFLVFLGTIGVMSLQNIHKGPQTASILTILPSSTTNTSPIQPTKIKNTPAPTLSLTSTTSIIITPSATPIPTPNTSTIPTPLPTISSTSTPQSSPLIQPTQTSTITPPPTTTSGHTFYTSSHWKSKFYYCDTDPDWHTLSATYLKKFNSEQELLAAYPTHVLHEPCK